MTCFLLNPSAFLMSYRNDEYGAAVAGSSWRFQEYSKSRAVQGLPSDHFESLRMVNVHTEPSAFDATLLAT